MPELDLQRRRNLSRLAAGVMGSFGRHPQRCRPLCALRGAAARQRAVGGRSAVLIPSRAADAPQVRRKVREGGLRMDRRQFFGDSVAGTIIRLVLLSVVVGVVFSALGITPFNLIERLQHLIRNITDMGLDAFNWAFKYFLLGAVIVFPIWFVVRLLGSRRTPPKA
jgi:hypothetical protein